MFLAVKVKFSENQIKRVFYKMQKEINKDIKYINTNKSQISQPYIMPESVDKEIQQVIAKKESNFEILYQALLSKGVYLPSKKDRACTIDCLMQIKRGILKPINQPDVYNLDPKDFKWKFSNDFSFTVIQNFVVLTNQQLLIPFKNPPNQDYLHRCILLLDQNNVLKLYEQGNIWDKLEQTLVYDHLLGQQFLTQLSQKQKTIKKIYFFQKKSEKLQRQMMECKHLSLVFQERQQEIKQRYENAFKKLDSLQNIKISQNKICKDIQMYLNKHNMTRKMLLYYNLEKGFGKEDIDQFFDTLELKQVQDHNEFLRRSQKTNQLDQNEIANFHSIDLLQIYNKYGMHRIYEVTTLAQGNELSQQQINDLVKIRNSEQRKVQLKCLERIKELKSMMRNANGKRNILQKRKINPDILIQNLELLIQNYELSNTFVSYQNTLEQEIQLKNELGATVFDLEQYKDNEISLKANEIIFDVMDSDIHNRNQIISCKMDDNIDEANSKVAMEKTKEKIGLKVIKLENGVFGEDSGKPANDSLKEVLNQDQMKKNAHMAKKSFFKTKTSNKRLPFKKEVKQDPKKINQEIFKKTQSQIKKSSKRGFDQLEKLGSIFIEDDEPDEAFNTRIKINTAEQKEQYVVLSESESDWDAKNKKLASQEAQLQELKRKNQAKQNILAQVIKEQGRQSIIRQSSEEVVSPPKPKKKLKKKKIMTVQEGRKSKRLAKLRKQKEEQLKRQQEEDRKKKEQKKKQGLLNRGLGYMGSLFGRGKNPQQEEPEQKEMDLEEVEVDLNPNENNQQQSINQLQYEGNSQQTPHRLTAQEILGHDPGSPSSRSNS